MVSDVHILFTLDTRDVTVTRTLVAETLTRVVDDIVSGVNLGVVKDSEGGTVGSFVIHTED